MFTSNPFASVSEFLPASLLQAYVLVMLAAVVAGTVFDIYHKGSARFFARRRAESRARAERTLSGAQRLSLAMETVAEAAVSGEFCKWPRRISHLLMMYGFFMYLFATVALIFGELSGESVLPRLWTAGALMILVGGLWFFFFLRVNVTYDGASPFHIGRADLFIGFLLLSVGAGLAWHFVQTSYAAPTLNRTLFGVYIFFTSLLFLSVPWSKFAHMFFKPAVAFQRRIEEADGSSDLPRPTTQNFIVRS